MATTKADQAISSLSVHINGTEQIFIENSKGYKAHQDITFNSVMANIHNNNILHTLICSKAQY